MLAWFGLLLEFSGGFAQIVTDSLHAPDGDGIEHYPGSIEDHFSHATSCRTGPAEYMSDGTEAHKSNWSDPEKWRALVSGEACPICLSGRPYGIVAELEVTHLTADEGVPFPGYCCLVLKRHAVELYDLSGEEAASLIDDMRFVSRVLQEVTGAVKINVSMHGNTLPHLHVHFSARYVGDPYEDGPIDFRLAKDTREFTYGPEEFRTFVEDLRAAVEAA